MTSGRLTPESREVVEAAYMSEIHVSAPAALRMAQKIIVSLPEFHTTNLYVSMGEREDKALGSGSAGGSYKAIIVLYMGGGADTYNREPCLVLLIYTRVPAMVARCLDLSAFSLAFAQC